MEEVKPMGDYDYVAAAKKIAHDLSKSGHANWSKRVLNGIWQYGPTGPTTLIGIRWDLEELRKSKVAISQTTEAEIADLMSKTEELWKTVVSKPPWSYYETAEKIAQTLSDAGYTDWSNRIRNAIAAGSTSGEILGELRWQLMELKTSGLNMSEGLIIEMTNLIGRLNTILGPVPKND